MSDKRTIAKILCLYLGTTGIFLCVFFGFLYTKEKQHLLAQQVSDLREISLEVYEILHTHKDDLSTALKYIQDQIKTPLRIYKKDKVVFDSLGGVELMEDEIGQGFALRGDKVIMEPSIHERIPKAHKKPFKPPLSRFRENPRYKIFLQDSALHSQILFLQFKLIVYFFLSLIVAGVIAYFLVRLFLKPMQEKIDSLNAFIKDSTHEINTPLSIILMSIETLESENLTPSQVRKIKRIALASKSLSHLYKDLVAYNFPHSVDNCQQDLDLCILVQERLEYFSAFFEQKALSILSDLAPSRIVASREKIICVIDNLLNNAIKYNKKGGEIRVVLKAGYLEIADSGCGMQSGQIQKVFERYVRCNEHQGGFGIGLALTQRICKEYSIGIEVKSMPEQGSSFILTWNE